MRKSISSILAVLIVVVVFVIAFASIILETSRNPDERITESTCTVIYGTAPLGYWLYCPSPMLISAQWGGWNLTVSISSNSVAGNEELSIKANLTSQANQTIKEFVEPIINYGVYALNGTLLWSWYPPQTTYQNMTVANGQIFNQTGVVPTDSLRSGQSYLVRVDPVAIQFPSPDNMTFTFQFSVS